MLGIRILVVVFTFLHSTKPSTPLLLRNTLRTPGGGMCKPVLYMLEGVLDELHE